MFIASSSSFAQDANNNGAVTFIYDRDEGECTLQVKDKFQLAIYHEDKPTATQPCKGRSIRFIQFHNVRSAVSLWLASEHDSNSRAIGCENLNERAPNNFLFELRTIKQVTNLTPIALDHLDDSQVGKPVIPGVLLKSRKVEHSARVNRHLSCIRINFD
jgi:hypothetical protein